MAVDKGKDIFAKKRIEAIMMLNGAIRSMLRIAFSIPSGCSHQALYQHAKERVENVLYFIKEDLRYLKKREGP